MTDHFSICTVENKNIKNDGFSGDAFTNVDTKKIKQGAITGAVGGFISGVGTLALGTGLVPAMGIGALSSVAAGQTQIVLDNASSNQKLTSGLFKPKDVLIDASVGAVSGALGYGINRLVWGAVGKIVNSPNPLDYPEGTAFSSAYDPKTNSITYRPSSENFPAPEGWVFRGGASRRSRLFSIWIKNAFME